MGLRDLLRRAPEAARPSPVDVQPEDFPAPAWPSAAPAEPAAETASDWAADSGFAAVAVEERPAETPGDWTAAAEPVDVTDHTIELPVLAAVHGPGRRRAVHAVLTLALVLACAGAALAASGVLRKKDEMPAPVRIGAASSIATKPPHRGKPATRAHHPARRRAHRHRRAHPHAAAAPAHVVAQAPAAPAPARAAPIVHHVVASPAPRPAPAPVVAPKPAPKPVATKPTTTTSQPAPSAPSGEAGRQPPPTS